MTPAGVLMAMLLLGLLAAACGDDDTSEEAGGPAVLVAVAPNETSRSEPSTAIRLIDLATNKRREIGDTAYYQTVRFSPDGRYLAAVGVDSRTSDPWVRMYDIESGGEVASVEALGEIAGISWAPTSTTLAVFGGAVAVLRPGETTNVGEGPFVPPDANPLSWAWTADGEVLGVIWEPGLSLIPVGEEAAAMIWRADFPSEGTEWGLRTTAEPREVGLVDLRPVSGIPEGRAEYPFTVRNGVVAAGEPQIVSIYDWNTLPTPEFDAATNQQFPIVRKTCSPCRSADGGSSLFILWVNDAITGPPADGADWPEGTKTLLAIELGPESATAVDLGLTPAGVIDVPAWRPVYDAVTTRGD